MSLLQSAVRWINTLLRHADVVDVTNAIGSSGRRVGRVKAWGRTGRRYTNGDAAPHLANRSTYSVATEDGWFVNCAQGKVVSWSKRPIHMTVADVWGRLRGGR